VLIDFYVAAGMDEAAVVAVAADVTDADSETFDKWRKALAKAESAPEKVWTAATYRDAIRRTLTPTTPIALPAMSAIRAQFQIATAAWHAAGGARTPKTFLSTERLLPLWLPASTTMADKG
jgi:hypothetical protein